MSPGGSLCRVQIANSRFSRSADLMAEDTSASNAKWNCQVELDDGRPLTKQHLQGVQELSLRSNRLRNTFTARGSQIPRASATAGLERFSETVPVRFGVVFHGHDGLTDNLEGHFLLNKVGEADEAAVGVRRASTGDVRVHCSCRIGR